MSKRQRFPLKEYFLNQRSKSELQNIAKGVGLIDKKYQKTSIEKLIAILSVYPYKILTKIQKERNETK